MSFCTTGEKATLSYAFGNSGSQEEANFEGAIDVNVTTYDPFPGLQQYNGNGYFMRFNRLGNPPWVNVIGVLGCGYYLANFNPNYGYEFYLIGCDGTVSYVGLVYPDQGSNPVTIDNSQHCPSPAPPLPDTTDTITVKQNGVTLVTFTGKHAAKYSVTCGDVCPEGTCKCEQTAYPGYCCLPCGEVASQINDMIQLARSKK